MDKQAHIAIYLLGGSSVRFGGDTPKQLIPVDGKPLFVYALKTLDESEEVDSIYLVVKEGTKEEVEKEIGGVHKIEGILIGGETREASVKKALDALASHYGEDALVLIQDADRPNLSLRMIQENYEKASLLGAAVTAIPCSDSLFLSEGGNLVSTYLNRAEAYLAQTPQTFRLGWIKEAHERQDGSTDDASKVFSLGKNIGIVLGGASNYKINTREDLERFKKEASK